MRNFCLAVSFALACMSVLCCRQPLSTEVFVKASARDASGRYSFRLDMEDSLAVYSIRFFTRADIGSDEFMDIPDIAADVLLESPSGKRYSERVYLRKEDFVSGNGFAKDYDRPYRTGFRPSEYGQWKMYLTLPGDNTGICGMGICLSKQIDDNGKR